MVHSGPFNGLCEIESSRGSPGISNIFLPMLQLLRTTPVVAPLPLPQTPASLPPTSRYHLRRRRQPPTESRSFLRGIRAGCERIFEFPPVRKGANFRETRDRNVASSTKLARPRDERLRAVTIGAPSLASVEKKARFLIFYPSSPKFETFFATCTKRREN